MEPVRRSEPYRGEIYRARAFSGKGREGPLEERATNPVTMDRRLHDEVGDVGGAGRSLLDQNGPQEDSGPVPDEGSAGGEVRVPGTPGGKVGGERAPGVFDR